MVVYVILIMEYRYILQSVSKPGVLCTYAYKVFDTEKKEIVSIIKREGALKQHMISDIKVDPANKDILYATAYNYNEGVVAKITLPEGKVSTISTTKFTNAELPGFYLLDEACSKVTIGAVCYNGNKRLYKVLNYNINDTHTVDSSLPRNQRSCIDSKSFNKMSGSHLVSIYNNEINMLEARCTGQSTFKMSAAVESKTQVIDVKD